MMKRFRKVLALVCAISLLLTCVPSAVLSEEVVVDKSESKTVQVIENTEPEEEFWEEVISKHIDDYTVTVTVTKEAEFPIGTTVTINPLDSDEYRNEAATLFDQKENELGSFIRAFDITFWYDGMEIEPLIPVDVKVTFDSAVELEGNNELKLIHLHEDEAAKEIEAETETAETEEATGIESLSFQSDKFSTYIVAEEVVVYTFSESGNNYEVVLKCNSAMGIPQDAVFTVEEITRDSDLYDQYAAQVAAVINPEGGVRMPALLDISLKTAEGEKIQLDNKVQVVVRLTDENLKKDLKIVHFPGEDPFQGESAVRDAVENSDHNEEIEVLDIESERLYARVNTAENTVTFNTASFSVFALAYTVDFFWNVNGENVEYSITGGGAMSLRELVEILNVLNAETNQETDEETSEGADEAAEPQAAPDYDAFMADIVNVTFSDESLLLPVRVSEDTTAGDLLAAQGLTPVYSADLSEEAIAAMNARVFHAHDWALVSLKPFDTEESLAVSLRDGTVLTIRVLDAQIVTHVITADGVDYLITVTYGREAGIPDDAMLEAREILPDRSVEAENQEAEADVESAEATSQEADADSEPAEAAETTEAVVPEAGATPESEETPEAMASEDEGEESNLQPLSEFDSYISRAETALGWEVGSASYARLFDIKIVDANGEKVPIAAPVDVRIELADKAGDESAEEATRVVHFADGAETGDVVTSLEVDGGTVRFEAEGFSAYAIVEGPDPIRMDYNAVASLSELAEHTDDAFCLSYGSDPKYFKNKLNNKKAFNETAAGDSDQASEWFFEKVSPDNNAHYRIYTYVNNAIQYVTNPEDVNVGLTTERESGAVFELSETGDGKFYFRLDGEDKWLQHSNTGGGIRFYTDNNNAGNAKITIAYADSFVMPRDPCNLDGKAYGLMNWIGGMAGKAMMTSPSGNGLEAKALTVLRTAKNSDQLFVPNDSDISMWTFQWSQYDYYYLTAQVGGNTVYLNISSGGLSLVDSQDQASRIQVIPGTGVHAGEICLKSGKTTLTYSGTAEGGFSVGGSAGNEWLYLVELSELDSSYLRTWSAQKVSVSDNVRVADTSSIIVYTRDWNAEKERYDFYAIDHDGKLVLVYEDGDSIEWMAGQLNTLLWNFTEYYWEGTTDPNYYYELYNPYSGNYLAPQTTGAQILSQEPIGINLNGRRDGKYYTPILAWDDAAYSYAGMKVVDGQIVPCPMSEAMDFYFAVMQDVNVDDTLTPVPTLDHTQYGITMKLIDLENGSKANDPNGRMNSFLGNSEGGVTLELRQGLLSTKLGSDGYPVAAGGSLGTLYNGAREVNNLFLESVYSSSGYFMYDSTQNFASLNTGNNFTVYKELGSYDSGGNKPTLKHGQFFPFNDLKPGVFTSVNRQNIYGLSGTQELSEGDPRKYEQLYSIQHGNSKVDPYFAMELEASFDQTPGGVDAWGHDIIFEFTGDDDFWLYVDEELVIDLGGIHSAVPGSVNFRTGVVNVNGTHTTLRTLFENNFIGRYESEHQGTSPSKAEVNEYLKQFFGEDESSTVFTSGSHHTMRIFYMERGSGASNLRMRFNLATARKGTVQLTKTLAGVDDPDSVKAEFPYQIFYKDQDGAEHPLKNAVPKDPLQTDDYVLYKDSVNPVKYEKKLVVGEVTYTDVFFLKPGETADISFPEGMTEYRIVECGINTDVYEIVTVNDTPVQGTGNAANRKDFGIDYATAAARPKVRYVNKVDEDALRTITVTKKLFRENGESAIYYDEDGTYFTFRLYLSSEYEGLDVADMQSYYVKDREGYYCRWDLATQKFVRLTDAAGQGISDYADLSEAQKKDSGVNFTTSIYGTIAKIPAYYTIEIRNVLAGTRYRVEERPWEIPDGYSFQKYEWNNQGAGKAEEKTTNNAPGIEGTVVSRTVDPEEPYVKVCNLKGWGLRLNKVWSDAAYMSARDAVYFAVFAPDGEGTLALVPETLRKLEYTAKLQTLYWYFLKLPVSGVPFNEYEIREVKITGNPEVDSDGVVTNEGSLTIELIPNEGKQTISGTQKGEKTPSEFEYTVLYDKGEIEEGSNVRVDTVTNNRPGIVLKKSKWDVTKPLSDAIFTLESSEGDLIGTFTSDEDGLITVAFLRDDVEYILTEIRAPQGWYGLQTPLKLTLSKGKVTVSGVDDEYYHLDWEDGKTPTLTVKDRPYTLTVIKKDKDTDEPMAGVHFSLHKEKKVGEVIMIDLTPEKGYEDLVTDADGVVPKIDATLPAGTYELREKDPPEGYRKLSMYIRFTVSPTGAVSLVPEKYLDKEVTLVQGTPEGDTSGTLAFTMTILNTQFRKVSFKKVDVNDPNAPLAGATFDLYALDANDARVTPALMTGLVSGKDGMLKDAAGNTVFELDIGTYHLVETEAPAGYNLKAEPVEITVEVEVDPKAVTYNEDTAFSPSTGKSYDKKTKVYTLKISNTPGVELPATGGPGTTVYTILGLLLISLAGAILLVRKRKHSV